MIKFPMKFEVEASSNFGIEKNWTAKANHLPPIVSAIPPEFNGPGGGYSPEDLFGAAILNCLIATFKVYSQKSKVTFTEITGKAIVTVDKNPSEPGFYMSHVEVFLEVTGASNPETARKLLEGSIKDCAVSNSIKSGKTFHLNVS